MDALFITWAAMLGLAVGSFLNVCISRLPEGQSVVRPRSQCPGCGSAIAWYDNIPLISFLLLRGCCRACHEKISWQYPLIELATLAIWVGMALAYGPTPRGLLGAILFSLLLAIAMIDAKHYLIPNALSIGGTAAGLALSLLPGPPTPLTSLIGAVAGYAVLYTIAVLGKLVFKKDAMGGGDMKMLAMIGTFLGPAHAMLTIFLGALAGSIIFMPSMKTGKLVPFGVFLALGAAVSFVFGDTLIDLYLGFYRL